MAVGWLRSIVMLLLATSGAVVVQLLGMADDALAEAPEVKVMSVSQQQLDGSVSLTTIHASFATDHDLVEVYNYVPVQRSTDWRLATSMDDATWIFRPGGGAPKLVIFFHAEAGDRVADLYDDQLGAATVPIAVKQNHVVLAQALHWTVRAQSSRPWLLADGRPSDDLSMEGAFALPEEGDTSGDTHGWRGRDAWDFRLADPAHTGIPTYSLLRYFPDKPPSSSVPRASLEVNVAHLPLLPFDNAVFWPYLGSSPTHLRSWFDRTPPLAMDWVAGRLVQLGSFLPDLEPEIGLQLFSVRPVLLHQENSPDFESPFAYYRFDPNHTGFPNLIIRHEYYPGDDPFSPIRGASSPYESVRYSWGEGNGLFQFKLGLLGRHEAPSAVDLGDLSVRTIPYDELPSWVLSRRWDLQTFVASEAGGQRSSEGIYEWDAGQGTAPWLSGESVIAPSSAYSTISAGYRGELAVLPAGLPSLYLSSVDGRLHLMGIQSGVWSIDQRQDVRVASLDGRTVGRWDRNVDGVNRETVYQVPSLLFYLAGDELVLQPEAAPAASVNSAPPRDRAGLDALRAAFPAQPPDVARDGLRALLPDDQSQAVRLSGARIDHVRLLPDGWRSELRLGPGARVSFGAATPIPLRRALAALGGCAPAAALPPGPSASCQVSTLPASAGLYVLSYDGTFHLQPAHPADVRLLALQASDASAQPSNAALTLTIQAANAGEADDDPRLIEIWAEQSGTGRPTNVANVSVALQAGERRTLTVDWLPPGPGQWVLRAQLAATDQGQAASIQGVRASVAVPPSAQARWWSLGSVADRTTALLAAGCLLMFAVSAGVCAWVLLR